MRIAISGTHGVGKTTLAEALADALPGYAFVPEPYRLLEDDGYDFAEMPSLDDFEQQLERAIKSLAESGPDTVFDRCPLDIAAYLLTHRDAHGFTLSDWMPRIREALASLDLVVFVPADDPAGPEAPPSGRRLRLRVDEAIAELIADDAFGLARPALTVAGSVDARVRQVLLVVRGASD